MLIRTGADVLGLSARVLNGSGSPVRLDKFNNTGQLLILNKDR